MKTAIKKLTLLSLIGLIVTSTSIANSKLKPQKTKKNVKNNIQTPTPIVSEKKQCLEMTINVECEGKKLKDIRIKKYLNNTLDTTFLSPRGSQKIVFNKDLYYTVEIIKEGYLPRLVSISTTLPSNISLDEDFIFEYNITVNLSAIGESASSSYYLDFPIAIIDYNKSVNNFYYREKYTKHIKKSITKEIGEEFAGK